MNITFSDTTSLNALKRFSLYFFRLFCIMLLSQSLVKGQNTNSKVSTIPDFTSTKIGIYSSLQGLLDNKPTDTSIFVIKKKPGIVQLFTFSSPNKLKYYDTGAYKLKKYKDELWGVFDGSTTYIHHAKTLSPIELNKQFCQFEYSSWRFIFVWVPIPIPVPMNYKSKFVYDIARDKKVWLTRYEFAEFLKEVDVELYKQFNKEKKQKKKIALYISKLNEKHPADSRF